MPSILDELATLFASAPSTEAILSFRPSKPCVDRANELLDMDPLDDASRRELALLENAELLMRLVKAKVKARISHPGS